MQQQHGALLWRKAVEQHQHRQGERVGHLRLLGRVIGAGGKDRLGEPLADVPLAPDPSRAQLVDRQPCRDGGHKGPGRVDLVPILEHAMEAEQRLLDDVLGLRDAAQHPVGDRERDRPHLLEQLLV